VASTLFLEVLPSEVNLTHFRFLLLACEATLLISDTLCQRHFMLATLLRNVLFPYLCWAVVDNGMISRMRLRFDVAHCIFNGTLFSRRRP
jgi:hypothetical protein